MVRTGPRLHLVRRSLIYSLLSMIEISAFMQLTKLKKPADGFTEIFDSKEKEMRMEEFKSMFLDSGEKPLPEIYRGSALT
jgi:hypothetical protein